MNLKWVNKILKTENNTHRLKIFLSTRSYILLAYFFTIDFSFIRKFISENNLIKIIPSRFVSKRVILIS